MLIPPVSRTEREEIVSNAHATSPRSNFPITSARIGRCQCTASGFYPVITILRSTYLLQCYSQSLVHSSDALSLPFRILCRAVRSPKLLGNEGFSHLSFQLPEASFVSKRMLRPSKGALEASLYTCYSCLNRAGAAHDVACTHPGTEETLFAQGAME